MDWGELKRRVAALAHDPEMTLISEALYAQFLDDAVDDLKSSGWLLPIEEDESLTMAADTYQYDVPADFAYIQDLFEEDSSTADLYTESLPQHMWKPGYDGGNPTIEFNANLWTPVLGKSIKVVGQKRPSKYTADSDAVEDGFIGFMRVRAQAYALLYMGTVPVEQGDHDQLERRIAIANTRIATGNAMMGLAERQLALQPQEFRVKPSSRHVKTR